MTPRDDRAGNEAQIRQLLDDRVKAVRAKDVTAVMTAYARRGGVRSRAAPGVPGAAANRRSLEEWFPTFRGPLGYEIRDLAITAGDEVAFCHSLNRISGARTDGTETDVWVRATVCFRWIGGRWAITHEHVSVPFEMTPPFKASLDLKP